MHQHSKSLYIFLLTAHTPFNAKKLNSKEEKISLNFSAMYTFSNIYLFSIFCRWQDSYNIMRDCWNKNPRLRPKFKTLLGNVSKLHRNIKTKRNVRDKDAWSGSKSAVRRNSFHLILSEKDIEDYDVSMHTSSYDYECFKTIQK